MYEQLLQFIWRHQYFNGQQLYAESGERCQIIFPGELNTHQGPDFLGASIRIGTISWIGNIELHVRASDWIKHAHHADPLYKNVILHVVWENDLAAGPEHVTKQKQSHSPFPILVLQHRVPKLLLGKYEEWMKRAHFVACAPQVRRVGKGEWSAWKHELLGQRLQRKAIDIETRLQQNEHHWEETTWWLLARNFGLSVNSGPFEAIARSLPLHMLARYGGQTARLEALLLGQAGLLEQEFQDGYPKSLQREFRYLQHKHQLSPIHQSVFFLRMRPENFPTIRLAQLAALLSKTLAWFASIKEAGSAAELKAMMDCTADNYWDQHYIPEEKSSFRVKKTGEQMKTSILINTCVPLLFTYGLLRGEKAFLDKAFRWLEELPAEKNSQIAGWTRIGVRPSNAADSQALLELRGQYCKVKKCLSCAVGELLLGRPLQRVAGG